MQKTPLSIRIIDMVTRTIYVLTIILCLGTIFFSFSFSTGIFADKLNMTIRLPVKSDEVQKGSVQFYGHEMEIDYKHAVGEVDSKDAPKAVARTFSVLILTTSAFAVFIMHLFCRFVSNVKNGVVFEIENIKLLRKLGFTLLGLYFFLLIGVQFWIHSFNTEEINPRLSIDGSQLSVLLSALFIIMISQIFLRGLEIQKENKLTI